MGRFVPNPRFETEAPKTLEMKAACRRAAQAALEEARRIAPVDTGEYRNSLRVEESDAGARLVADDEKATYIEFGTGDTPAFGPLRRGTEAAGLKPGRKR